MIDESRLVDLFRDLVEIDSPSLREAEAVAYTKAYLVRAGLDVVEDDAGARIGGNANNLIATLPANAPGLPRVFLSAHLDTVEPTPGLRLVEEDGVFRPSTDTVLGADDKAGVAPAIEGVLALRASGVPHGDVVLLISVAEEIGLKGAAALRVEDLDLDFGYVLDTGPPVGTYVTRTATHDKLDVTVHGRPAHAGKDPENGVNAIVVAARAIAGMRIGRIDPETTTNIGVIEGGTAVNVVCPSVRLRAEARSTSVATLDAEVAHMVAQLESAARAMGASVEVDHRRHYESYDIPADARVVRVGQAASRRLGLEPTLRTTLGGSDANVFNAKGVPCVVMATGMQRIHTHEEFILRKDLVDTARLVVAVLEEAQRTS